MRIVGRLQTQAYYFSNDDSSFGGSLGPQSNFFVRRARIAANVQITETVFATIEPSFEDGSTRLRLRNAYIDVGFQRGEPTTRFTLRMGQEKRPFNRYELYSSDNLPSIERGAGRGLVRASSNDLFIAHGFLSHDVGAALLVRHKLGEGATQALTFQAGVYNGAGESRNDVNDAKSFACPGHGGGDAEAEYRRVLLLPRWHRHSAARDGPGFVLQEHRVRRGRLVGPAGR